MREVVDAFFPFSSLRTLAKKLTLLPFFSLLSLFLSLFSLSLSPSLTKNTQQQPTPPARTSRPPTPAATPTARSTRR